MLPETVALARRLDGLACVLNRRCLNIEKRLATLEATRKAHFAAMTELAAATALVAKQAGSLTASPKRVARDAR